MIQLIHFVPQRFTKRVVEGNGPWLEQQVKRLSPRAASGARISTTSSRRCKNWADAREVVGTLGAGIERRTGRGENLPALFLGKSPVISEPERRAASTTSVASDRPDTMRLRRGKSRPRGS